MPSDITIRRLLNRYVAERLPQLKSGDRIKRSLRLILRQDMSRPAVELSSGDIAAAISRAATAAPTHANRSLGYLRAFFEWAVREGHLEANPARRVEMPAAEKRRDRVLTLEEIVDIWSAAPALGYPFAQAIRLMLLTGMHREQVAAMLKDDVEFGDLGGVGSWRLPGHKNDYVPTFVVALHQLARREVFEAMPKSTLRSRYVFTTTGRSAVSGWSRAKRKLDGEINRRRAETGREEISEWRLDDLRQSLVANVEEHLRVNHQLAISCLHVQSGFSSLKQRFMAYCGVFDSFRTEVLAAWARLVEEAARPGAILKAACALVENETDYTGLAAFEFDEFVLEGDVLDAMYEKFGWGVRF